MKSATNFLFGIVEAFLDIVERCLHAVAGRPRGLSTPSVRKPGPQSGIFSWSLAAA